MSAETAPSGAGRGGRTTSCGGGGVARRGEGPSRREGGRHMAEKCAAWGGGGAGAGREGDREGEKRETMYGIHLSSPARGNTRKCTVAQRTKCGV